MENNPPSPQEMEMFDANYQEYTRQEQPYLLIFVNMSLGAVYRHWVETGRREPMEDMIRLTIRLISCGLGGNPN